MIGGKSAKCGGEKGGGKRLDGSPNAVGGMKEAAGKKDQVEVPRRQADELLGLEKPAWPRPAPAGPLDQSSNDHAGAGISLCRALQV